MMEAPETGAAAPDFMRLLAAWGPNAATHVAIIAGPRRNMPRVYPMGCGGQKTARNLDLEHFSESIFWLFYSTFLIPTNGF